ncbi:unnamed protein product [Nyctereutes procyonoides]|uniref:(raccoon dog) hypothetical protein n=1 Tax=Nyctereutes procyonoides TaxID=34880 RepID=A0A811ZGB7_NYCPR|nr:unnamed protein product [Nyctereutes procyonoides]
MPLTKDLLHPSLEEEKRKHKKKHLVQSPTRSARDSTKAPPSSATRTVVLCISCSNVLCQPTGEKARLIEGCPFRQKQH